MPALLREKRFVLLAVVLLGSTLFVFGDALRGIQDPCASLTEQREIFSCRQDVVKKMLQEEGPGAAAVYIKGITEENPSGGRCHMLMHMLGFLTYEHSSDLEEVFAHPDLLHCMGGFLHGSLEGYLGEHGSEGVSSTTLSVCAASNDAAFGWECFHGLGHALMFIFDGDIFKSVEHCDLLPTSLAKNRCYYGAFMENSYQHHQLSYHGPSGKFIKEDDPYYPCYELEDQYQAQCYRFTGRTHLLDIVSKEGKAIPSLGMEDFKSAFDACRAIPGPERYRAYCVSEVPVYIQIAYPRDFDSSRAACEQLERFDHRRLCFHTLVRVIDKYDTHDEGLAESFCEALSADQEADCKNFLHVEKDPCLSQGKKTEIFTCREEAIKALLKAEGPQAAVEYVRTVTQREPSGGTCHVLMHLTGFLTQVFFSDIQKTFAGGDLTYCMGGFMHGALEAYLAEQGTAASTTIVHACDFIDERASRWECMHALGHGLMYANENDVMASLGKCDDLASLSDREACYYGAFMEHSFQRHGLFYHGPSKTSFIKEEDLYYPCNALDERYKSQCYAFSGRSYLLEIAGDQEILLSGLSKNAFENAFEVCYGIEDAERYQENCIWEVPVYMQIAFPRDFEMTRTVCDYLRTDSERGICYSRMTLLTRKYDTRGQGLAGRFCAGLEGAHREKCFETIEADVLQYPSAFIY